MKELLMLIVIMMSLLLGACSSIQEQPTNSEQSIARPDNFILDIKSIAGKSSSSVEKVLGHPCREEKVKDGFKTHKVKYYRNGDIEIVYVQGVADWITIQRNCNIIYGEDALSQFGLPKMSPTFINPTAVIRWENIPNIKELSLFPGGNGKCFYAYILVNSVP